MMRVVLLFDEIVFLGEVVMINVSESQMFFLLKLMIYIYIYFFFEGGSRRIWGGKVMIW